MKIKLYHNSCPMCMLIERQLKEKHIQYEETTDVNEILKLGFETVPVLQIDDKFYVGGNQCLNALKDLGE